MAMTLAPPERTILVRNKSDLPRSGEVQALGFFSRQVEVSVKQETGLAELQTEVVAHFCGSVGGEVGEGVVLTERRHRDALGGAQVALERFLAAEVGDEPLECLAIEMRESLAALGQITGETTPDAILEQIFSRFCIGK